MLVKFSIDGKEYEEEETQKILMVCLNVGIYIPHICFLKGHSPSGHCGLCVVNLKKDDRDRIVYSCIENVSEGIEITTNSRELEKIRRGHMNRIIKNHCLDCLRCFKTNNCKLQEYIYKYGADPFTQPITINTAGSKDVYTQITDDILFNRSKCINCNRCVKFLSETCKMNCKSIEIADYSTPNTDDIFGNVIDICPTAAIKANNGVWKTPSSMTDVIETYDVSNVFMPQLKIISMNGEIVEIRSVKKQWITNDMRFYPHRGNTIQNELPSDIPTSPIAIILPEYLDIETFFILQYIAEHDDKFEIVIDDLEIPKELFDRIGVFDVSVSKTDCAIFVDILKTSTKFYIKRKMHLLKKEFNISKIENIPSICSYNFPYNFPYVFINANAFPVEVSFLEKHNIPFSIIPANSSQILLKIAKQYTPAKKLNNEVNKMKIGWKHFFEESAYYLNAFGNIIKTEQVISTDSISTRDFAQSLLKKLAPNDWERVLQRIYREIASAAIADR
ncbi:MAG: (2Fe-2S)-binding protein [Holosporales bacterium]|jgi:hypothetical protein|nr:(2Fe-2S)-binding protein [Holosporales bacterium]